MASDLQLYAGKDIRLRKISGGYIISSKAGRSNFSHPFQVSLAGNTATLRPGIINGVPATINGMPLEGTDGKPVPSIEWQQLRMDLTGRGWIAVEVTCGDDWEVKTAEVVQVGSLDSLDGSALPEGLPPYSAGGSPGLLGRKARHPIAMLRRRKRSGQVDLFQVTHFNLQHRAFVRDEASEIARHFFFPAG